MMNEVEEDVGKKCYRRLNLIDKKFAGHTFYNTNNLLVL